MSVFCCMSSFNVLCIVHSSDNDKCDSVRFLAYGLAELHSALRSVVIHTFLMFYSDLFKYAFDNRFTVFEYHISDR